MAPTNLNHQQRLRSWALSVIARETTIRYVDSSFRELFLPAVPHIPPSVVSLACVFLTRRDTIGYQSRGVDGSVATDVAIRSFT